MEGNHLEAQKIISRGEDVRDLDGRRIPPVDEGIRGPFACDVLAVHRGFAILEHPLLEDLDPGDFRLLRTRTGPTAVAQICENRTAVSGLRPDVEMYFDIFSGVDHRVRLHWLRVHVADDVRVGNLVFAHECAPFS